MPHAKRMLGGIFVGGASRRMGRAKALLPVFDADAREEVKTLLERTVSVARAAGLAPVIVGHRPELSELESLVRSLGLPVLEDAAVDAGPLAGLVALLQHARDNDGHGGDLVLALSCDLPAVQPAHLRRLIDASPDAPIVAARRDGRWEPLAARYSATAVLPFARRRLAARQLGLQGLLDEAGALELARGGELDDLSWLDDWDTPDDVLRSASRAASGNGTLPS